MFNPLDFFILAQDLGMENEAKVRTVIGRTYYACFLLAHNRLQLALFLPEIHQEVIRGLYRRKLTPTAERLRQLRRLRNQADYDLGAVLVASKAQKALELANSIISDLRRC